MNGSPAFWVGGGAHDGQDPRERWPILSLAHALVFEGQGTTEDLPGVLFNLWNADREGGSGIVRFVQDHDDYGPICVGFLAYARIGLDKLPRIAPENVRVVPQDWYRADGAVAFVTEALSYGPRLMIDGVRYVSELPGVQILCGWRKGRFRIQQRRR